MRKLISVDDLYAKHKKMIYKLIHRYANEHVTFEDLESASNEVFTKCYHKWDPKRARFSTLLYRALTNRFKSELAKGEVRLRNEGEAEFLSRKTDHIGGAGWLKDFVQELDKEARQVIGKLLSMDIDPDTKANEVRDEIMGKIVEQPGRTKASVERAFANIKMALKA